MKTLSLVLCLAVCLSACGAQSQTGPAQSPHVAALAEASAGVLESNQEARETSEDADSFLLTFRHNPSQCDSPEFEVYFKGRWVRAYLEIEVPEAKTLLEGLRTASTKGTTIELNALPTSSTRLSALRVEWPVVEVVSLPASPQGSTSSMTPSPALKQSTPC